MWHLTWSGTWASPLTPRIDRNMTPSSPFSVDDFSTFAAGSGAIKLVSSAVAPLVALARGMRSIEPDDVKALNSKLGYSPVSGPAKQIRRAVGGTDALFMPWYLPDQVVRMETSGWDEPSAAPQLRPHPSNVELNNRGKPIKYINMTGAKLGLGPHPATPKGWLLSPGRALFTEGMLKADSALTAMLLANGIGADDLKLNGDPDMMAARNRLRGMLSAIPDDRRVVIYAFVSVTTWSANPEWNAIHFGNQDVYVAFDGDMSTNLMVWKQAHALWEFIKHKRGVPNLIDFTGVTLPDGSKVGMDDYLAQVGGWDAMLALSAPTMIARPAIDDEPAPGDWRMNNISLVTEGYRAGVDESQPGTWISKHDFVARVKTVEDRRTVSAEEMRTGLYSGRSDARLLDSRVEIEVAWTDRMTREPASGIVHGNSDILTAVPSEWRRIPGTSVPSQVALLPTWPPREPEWLKAMKSNRVDEISIRPLWNNMGWVPTLDSTPVFVVGEQVVGPGGFEPTAAASAVGSKEIANAHKFGVQMPDSDDEAANAIRKVLDTYCPTDLEHGPWRNPKHASIFLAAALRPCVPIQTNVPVLLSGASGAGKSWSSAAAMAFWQEVPGTWTEKSLPGSASDTVTAAEVSVSKTPIWVIDDLAPSDDNPAKHGRQADDVWTIVRGIHNGAFKQRRRSDMSAGEINVPRALLIVSTEVAPESRESIMNRVVHIHVEANQFLSASRTPTRKLVEMSATESPQSIITGYILRMLARRMAEKGWERVVAELRDEERFHAAEATTIMSGSPSGERQARTVADLALGLTVLGWAVSELGLDGELYDRLSDMREDLYQVAKDGYNSAKTIVLGAQFMTDLASTLRSHRGHIGAVGVAGPPISSGDTGFHRKADETNDLLGWELGIDGAPPRAGGNRIGIIVEDDVTHQPAVLFDPAAALALVRATNGSYKTHSVKSVWESAIQHGYQWRAAKKGEPGWMVKTSGGGAGWRQRVSRGGTPYEGVAVPLWKLLGYTDENGPDGEEGAA